MDFKEITKKIKNFGLDNPLYWTTALSGEVGEFCNIIKKIFRDNLEIDYNKLRFELADIFIYTYLNSEYWKIDLEKAIIDKIEIINKKLKE